MSPAVMKVMNLKNNPTKLLQKINIEGLSGKIEKKPENQSKKRSPRKETVELDYQEKNISNKLIFYKIKL